MAADEENALGQLPFDALYNLRFRTAGIRQQCARGTVPSGMENLSRDALHRSTENRHVRLANRCDQVQRALMDGTDSQCLIKAGSSPAGTDYSFNDLTALGGQANRAADEPHADDGERLDFHQSRGMRPRIRRWRNYSKKVVSGEW